MVYKPRRERRASGGKAALSEPLHPEHGNQYNAVGSPEEKEEHAGPDGFKHGGAAKKKRKAGGHVEGHGATHHMGKRARGGMTEKKEHRKEEHRREGGKTEPDEMPRRARGGHVRRASGGGTPYSSAHKLSPPGNDKKTGPGENTESIP